jgi:hypothetical protein
MANSVSTTSGSIVAILGGGLGFAIRSLVGANGSGSTTILVCAAVTYLGASLAARTMGRDLLGPVYDPDRPQTREALRHVATGLADGARHVWHHRVAGHALAAIAAHRFCYGLSTIATILLYRNYFNDPADVEAGLAGLGIAFLASGLGFLTAAVITPEITPRIGKRRWMVVLFGCAAIVQVLLGAPYREPLLVVAAFLLGVVAQGAKICVDTIVQESIDDAYRGRVFSFYDVLFNVSFVSAAVVAALALPASGRSYAVLGMVATGYAVTAGLYASTIHRRSRVGTT